MHNALTITERQEGARSITARFGTQVPRNIAEQCDLLIKEGNYERQLQIIRALHDLLHNETGSLTRAKEIIEKGGGKFYGPESLKAMKLKIPDTLPPLPPTEEIERYAKQGFSLRLMPDVAPDKAPLTMEKMNEILDPLIKKCQNKQNPNDEDWKLLYKVDWYATEDLYKKAVSPLCWVFTSDKLLGDSTGINYLAQTDCIDKYVRETLYDGKPLPQEVQKASEQFKGKRANIDKNIKANKWKDAVDELKALDITQLFRPEAQDVIFFFAQTFLNSPPNKRERLLEALYAWTKTQSSDGYLVYAGGCYPEGAVLYGCIPDGAGGRLGVFLVRKFPTHQAPIAGAGQASLACPP